MSLGAEASAKAARDVEQVAALTRAFLARFFESEITTGADDLKGTFFWLLAALATPGIVIPWIMVFDWNFMSIVHGYEGLRLASRAEKAFYLGLSMFSAGALTTIVWSSLLPDKRDTLILGSLPVRPRTVILAKLAALAGYIGVAAFATHVVGSLFWGSILGNNGPGFFVIRSIIAHFVASAALSMFVCLAIAAAQGMLLTITGPRLFPRASTVLQAAVVGLLAISLAWLPIITVAARQTIGGGPRAEPWILALPPMWFLGLYEWILGTNEPVIGMLARRAVLAFGGMIALTLLTYPLAFRRLMVSVVESGQPPQAPLSRAIRWCIVRAAGRDSAARAAAEFFVTTVARVERQRFMVAIGIGIALAWTLPGLRSYEPSAAPQPQILALPIAAMMFLLAGLRIASSLPADVRAGWVFEVHDISRRRARQALERVMIVVGVLPPILLSAPFYWRLWGGAVMLTHAALMLALGVAIVELLIWHCNGMPCGGRFVPTRLDFGRRWPVHAVFFLIVVSVIPRLEAWLFRSELGAIIFVSLLLVGAFAVRYASSRHVIVPIYDDVDPVAGVLRIN